MRFIPDSPTWAWAYRPVEPPPTAIDEAARRHDPGIRLRFNRFLKRWEVWFLRAGQQHTDLDILTPEEINKKASFWFAVQDADGEPLPLRKDEILDTIFKADWWRRSEIRAVEAERALAAQDAQGKIALKKEVNEELEDWFIDHKNQLMPLKDMHSPEHMKLVRKGL